MRLAVLTLFAFACATETEIVGDADAGATIFADNCASCHAADGTGGTGSSLVGLTDEASMEATIVDGDGGMPAFGESLDDQDVADVIAFILTL